MHENPEDRFDVRPVMVVSASSLSENVEDLASLPNEVMLSSDLHDLPKIKDALTQKRVGMEQGFAAAGNSAALARVASYYLPAAVAREQLGGIDFYRFLKDLLDHFDERAEGLAAKLEDVANRIFSDDRLTVSFTGSDEDFERFWEAGGALGRFEDREATTPEDVRLDVPAPLPRNEAFVVPTDVVYAATGYDRRLLGLPYSGTWLVASRALSYDYLWNEVRVKGGAYGAGFQATRAGSLRFYSYRDPHLDETAGALQGRPAPGFPRSTPQPTARWTATWSSTRGLAGRAAQAAGAGAAPGRRTSSPTSTRRHVSATRAEAVHARAQDVRSLGAAVTAAAAEDLVCVFGNKDVIAAEGSGLAVIDLLNEWAC